MLVGAGWGMSIGRQVLSAAHVSTLQGHDCIQPHLAGSMPRSKRSSATDVRSWLASAAVLTARNDSAPDSEVPCTGGLAEGSGWG
jgi:hypothetical protein